MPDVGEGCLVLADVSGYAGFLAGLELEHASGILGEPIQEMLDVSMSAPLPGPVRRRARRSFAERRLPRELAQLQEAMSA